MDSCSICGSKDVEWETSDEIFINKSKVVIIPNYKCLKCNNCNQSVPTQESARQEVLMEELGVDKIYIDRVSGKDTNRPELQSMIEFVREGDVVIVESISRFARNTKDLLELVDKLIDKKVTFIAKKENIDVTTFQGKYMLTVFGAMYEMELQNIKQRQKEGVAIAKQKGVYKGRKRIDCPNFTKVYNDWKADRITAVRAVELLKISKSTFYRKVEEFEKLK